ncbi:MAG: hypothetical protein KBG15_23760 [Kofleriaceae bacterium]|nr:hypothetical protein [Kofleriaceae bacterium]
MRSTLTLAFFAVVTAGCESKEVTTGGDFFVASGSDQSSFAAGVSADMKKSDKAGSGNSVGAAATATGSGSAGSKGESIAAITPGSGSGSATRNVATVSGSGVPTGSGSIAAPVAVATVTATPTVSLLETTGVVAPAPGQTPVPPSAEQAAIKLTLAPGWARDLGEAGTISVFLALAQRGLGIDTNFIFHYGIEKSGAPKDREAYKAWLAAENIMTVTRDRQRGAAWFLEGKSPTGSAMFRYQVRYGGKFLICGGSMYKDGEPAKLGKFRDAVMIQVEKICETITL